MTWQEGSPMPGEPAHPVVHRLHAALRRHAEARHAVREAAREADQARQAPEVPTAAGGAEDGS